MDPDHDSAGSVVSEISSAISDIREGDALAESQDRTLAADRYLEAISQLKGAHQNTDGELGDVVEELLECANEHARMLIDERPVSEAKDIGEIINSIGSSGRSDTGEQAEGDKRGMEQTSRDVRERIAEANRLRRKGKYGEAIEVYTEAKEIVDHQLTRYSARQLEPEINLYLEKLRPKRKRAVQQISRLDSIIAQLEQDTLARHEFEFPYQRAAVNPETVDEPSEAVYSPPLDPENLISVNVYYRELESFERQLAATAEETGGATAVTKRIGVILDATQSAVAASPEENRAVLSAAIDVLEAYVSLSRLDDKEGITDLRKQLETVRNDVNAGDYDEQLELLATRLDTIQVQTSQRANHVEAVNEAAEELDAAIQQLDHDLLAEHGLDLLYRRAAVNPNAVSEPAEAVYQPPFNPEAIDAVTAYYEKLKSFERQLAATAEQTGRPTAVTIHLITILEIQQSEIPTDPEASTTLLSAASSLLKTYERLTTQNDDDGVSELEERLETILSDTRAGEYHGNTESLVAQLNGVQEWVGERSSRVEAFHESVDKLDAAIRGLDQALLARHGVEFPYQRAGADPDAVSVPNHDVYEAQIDSDLIGPMTAYYRELKSFERQLAATVNETGNATAVTKVLGKLIEASQPDSLTNPKDARAVVGAATDLLNAYETLVTKGDNDGISDLERRLDTIHSDIVAGESKTDPDELAARLDDITTWIGERGRRVELQSRRDDILETWPATAGEQLRLDVAVVDQLTGVASGEPPLSQFEAGLQTAERVVALAEMVETTRNDYQAAVLDRLPEAFGQYLNQQEITAVRLEQLEETLDVIETACDAHRQYPSYPFNQVATYCCAELETGTADYDIEGLSTLLKAATDVLEFLEAVDATHPNVEAEEWKEAVQTSLEAVSPETIEQLVDRINQIDEALWEHHHLFEFSWEEFEHLLGQLWGDMGYRTTVSQATSDRGIDVTARNGDETVLIQAKQKSDQNKVGRPTIQKTMGVVTADNADRGVVVTTSSYRETAVEEANKHGEKMRLISKDELLSMLTESRLAPPTHRGSE